MGARVWLTIRGQLALEQAEALDEERLGGLISEREQFYLREFSRIRGSDRANFQREYALGIRDVLAARKDSLGTRSVHSSRGYSKDVYAATAIMADEGYLLGEPPGTFEEKLLEYVGNIEAGHQSH